MAKASGTTEREFRKMSMSSKRATDQMEKDAIRSTTRINQAMATVSTKIGSVGKAFADGMGLSAATLGITGFVAATKNAIQSTAELSRQARMAGVDIEAFQELKFVAEQNKIGVDALTDGLKEMNLRADEFIATGAGGGAEAFQRLGYSSEELAKKIKKPSDLFVEIIGRMKQFERAAQIRLGDEIFGGTAGERFVELVDQGAEGLNENIKLAREMGLVMNEGMVKQAEEVDKKINILANTIGNRLKKEILEAAQGWLLFYNSWQEFEQQSDKRVRGALGDVYSKLDAAKQNLKDLEQVSIGSPADAINIKQAQQEVERLTSEAMKFRDILDRRQGYSPDAPAAPAAPVFTPKDTSAEYMRSYREELAKTNRERQIATETEKILADAASKGASLTREQAAALAQESVARSERDAASKKSASESERAAKTSERERKAVQDLIAELEEELRIVNLSDAAKRASAASRQAGAAATDEERRKIIALNEAIHQEQEAQDEAEKRRLFYRDLTRAGLDDLFSAIEEGKSFWEAMGDVAVNSLKRIADTMLDDVLDSIFQVNKAASGGGGGGGGFFSSLLSGLFGGGSQWAGIKSGSITGGLFANGGAFPNGINGFSNQVVSKPTMFAFADGAGLMGEAGPEAIMPLSRDGSGRLGVAVNGSTASGAGSASGGSSEVLVKLSPELVGEILKQTGQQSVKLIAQNNKDTQNFKSNGGREY
ncbi:tail tape measure protein [Agrobacterium tumefaciens]|nr:tail tape measure protein [Agrobacterium tumefaciens]